MTGLTAAGPASIRVLIGTYRSMSHLCWLLHPGLSRLLPQMTEFHTSYTLKLHTQVVVSCAALLTPAARVLQQQLQQCHACVDPPAGDRGGCCPACCCLAVAPALLPCCCCPSTCAPQPLPTICNHACSADRCSAACSPHGLPACLPAVLQLITMPIFNCDGVLPAS